MSEIPQWALDEARRRSGHSALPCPAMDELARMIAEHEEPPVDPLQDACRRVGIGRQVAEDLRAELARRGIEIGKQS